MSAVTIQQACTEACFRTGVIHRYVPSDGRFHLADIADDPRGRGDARIKLFTDGKGGVIANNKTNERRTFFVSDPREFSAAERHRCLALAAIRRREFEAAELERHTAKAAEICALFETGISPSGHNYLHTKRLPGLGLHRVRGKLFVPLMQGNGAIQGLQTIGYAGEKRFFPGAKKKGLFCPIGWRVGDPLTELIIAEGWASACAAHQMFQLPAAAAMDCGNLLPAARTIRKRYPGVKLIFAADWDGHAGGIGFTAACEAAQALGNAKVIKPECADDAHHDFADSWLQLRGAK